MKKLYLIHCGFYDSSLSDGVYESHVNHFVVADSFEDAKKIAKLDPIFKNKHMHVDGMQEISRVCGFEIQLKEISGADDTIVISKRSDFTG